MQDPDVPEGPGVVLDLGVGHALHAEDSVPGAAQELGVETVHGGAVGAAAEGLGSAEEPASGVEGASGPGAFVLDAAAEADVGEVPDVAVSYPASAAAVAVVAAAVDVALDVAELPGQLVVQPVVPLVVLLAGPVQSAGHPDSVWIALSLYLCHASIQTVGCGSHRWQGLLVGSAERMARSDFHSRVLAAAP